MVVEPRISAPAEIEGTVNMAFGPFHNPADFVPVGNALAGNIVQGSPCDDHAVVPFVFDLVKGIVKLGHMAGIGMGGLIAGSLQEFHLNLQGRVGQLPEKLGLGDDFGGHQIQDQHV